MTEYLMEYYNWILAFHVMSFLSWMAVLFYLPRLYVYHAEHKEKPDFVKVVKIMEAKLYNFIGIPSFWATLLSGLAMIWIMPELFNTGGWLHAKLLLALFMIIFFFYLSKVRKNLENDSCNKSGKFFRILNEVPTILMIGIVIFVVIKPF